MILAKSIMRHITGLGILIFLLLTFRCSKNGDNGSSDTDGTTENDPTIHSVIKKKAFPNSASSSSGPDGSLQLIDRGLSFLTPEEYSAFVRQNFSFQFGWTDAQGRFHDLITSIYGVPLGGVDFDRSLFRDPVPKITTVLVIRWLAWEIASGIVWRDEQTEEKQEGDKVIFSGCLLRSDRPFMVPEDESLSLEEQQEIRHGEVRWQRQLEDLYWRSYSRAPSVEEVTMMREAFVDMYRIQEWAPAAWRGLLYTMLASSEVWYR